MQVASGSLQMSMHLMHQFNQIGIVSKSLMCHFSFVYQQLREISNQELGAWIVSNIYLNLQNKVVTFHNVKEYTHICHC